MSVESNGPDVWQAVAWLHVPQLKLNMHCDLGSLLICYVSTYQLQIHVPLNHEDFLCDSDTDWRTVSALSTIGPPAPPSWAGVGRVGVFLFLVCG